MKYFDMYFESSYHEKLSKLGKDVLRNEAKRKLDCLAAAVDFTQEPKVLLKSIERRFYEEAPYVDYSTFAYDFPEDRRKRWGDERNDCVLYAQLVVAALENVGREDVIEKLSVKADIYHCWLSYGDVEINRQGHTETETKKKEWLSVSGMNNTAIQLHKRGLNADALKVVEEGISIDASCKLLWNNKAFLSTLAGKTKEAGVALREYERLSSME